MSGRSDHSRDRSLMLPGVDHQPSRLKLGTRLPRPRQRFAIRPDFPARCQKKFRRRLQLHTIVGRTTHRDQNADPGDFGLGVGDDLLLLRVGDGDLDPQNVRMGQHTGLELWLRQS